MARFDEREVARLLGDAGIVRNDAKIRSAVRNARATLGVIEERGSLGFLSMVASSMASRGRTAGAPGTGARPDDRVRRHEPDLKRRGFNFVGSTICYAFMQAVGMVNDHLVGCFRHAPLRAARGRAE